MTRFKFTYDIYCKGAAPSLTRSFALRANDPTPSPFAKVGPAEPTVKPRPRTAS